MVEISGLGNADRQPADVNSSRVVGLRVQGVFVCLRPPRQVEKEDFDCEDKATADCCRTARLLPPWSVHLETALCLAGHTVSTLSGISLGGESEAR